LGQKYNQCPAPNCERHLLPGRSPHGLCPHHEELLDFLLFILPNITMEQGKTPSGLLLPGQPGFQIAPDAVIKQGIEKRGRLK